MQAIHTAIEAAVGEINKVIIGKDDVVRKVMMSILADGHILIDDAPGVGKTSLAMNIVTNASLNTGAKCAIFL